METVELYISTATFWQIVAAVILGCAIYDTFLDLFGWAWRKARDGGRDGLDWLAGYRAEKPLRLRAWHAIVGLPDPPPERFVPDVPERVRFEYVLNEATRSLHRRSCKNANSDACAPWEWASTASEARYFAGEQGLKTGCSCRPLVDPVEAAL